MKLHFVENAQEAVPQLNPEAPARKARLPKLRIEVSLAEGFPWPSLIVRAAARIKGSLVRFRNLRQSADGFSHDDHLYDCDQTVRLLLRTIMALPSEDGIAYRGSGSRFAPLLTLLRSELIQECEDIRFRQSDRIAACTILKCPPEPVLALDTIQLNERLKLKATPFFNEKDEGAPLGFPLFQDSDWMVFGKAIAPAPEKFGSPALRQIFESGPCELEDSKAWDAVDAAIRSTSVLSLRMSDDLAHAALAQPPVPCVKIDPIESSKSKAGSLDQLKARLDFAVGQGFNITDAPRIKAEEILAAAQNGQKVICKEGRWCRIDAESVQKARSSLLALGKANGTPDSFVASEEQIPEILQWARTQKAQSDSPWNIYVSESVEGAHQVSEESLDLRLNMDLDENGENSWFKLTADLQVEGQPLSSSDIKNLIRKKRTWFRRGNSWYKFDPKSWKELEKRAEHLGLRATGFGQYRLNAETREKIDSLFSLAGSVEHSDRYRAFLAQLKAFQGIDHEPMAKDFRLSLRGYQHHGYNWLLFLSKFGLNGILADDMGLGKTAQTLAMLVRMKELKGSAPSLIVCPTSLVDNWAAEVQKFAPSLTVIRYSGSPNRRDRLRAKLGNHDLILATYATVRNDASLLMKEGPWRYIILDEAHAIKNPSAAVSKAVKTIPAQHRLALSGTPVQNRLQELWSIFDFLMPGFLGRRSSFFRQYEEPITLGQSCDATGSEKTNGRIAGEALRDRIRPFVLRRLKTEVAKDLPAKIIQEVPCRLSADQAALYRKFARSKEAQSAVKEVEEKGAALAQTEILTALGMLRKICNHPDLVHLGKDIQNRRQIVPLPGYEERSGKLQVLGELLEQCRVGDHRALIFSQHTSMMDILEHFLSERGNTYLRLDGGTNPRHRQGMVDKFNQDPSIHAFMISTRAGGSGLNLTGADTVIFYDHDWNPANDRQAEDRAYRIGQNRSVNVYRLVTQGTLEEKILERQRRKQDLADAIVKNDPVGLKTLSREELLGLFTLEE